MSKPLRAIFTALVLLLTLAINAQYTIGGRVVDAQTGEPLAFVAIASLSSNQGTYSDIDGRFELNATTSEKLTFYFIGYEPLNYTVSSESLSLVFRMQRKSLMLSEVVIRPGVNPAERIIQQAIENKKKNDPEGEETFSYDSYNKLVFTAEVDTSVFNNPMVYNSLDSSNREMVDFFKEQHLFLMESASKRKFMPPNRSEETIVASRVSGLKSPEFALLGTQLQSFSFYGELVNILDVSYLSPLANHSYHKYLFIIEDTTFVNSDTVFTISFRPKKGKNFDGMKGQLFINTDGYALQNVIAEPKDSSAFSIKIQQMYEKVGGTKWFPVQLNSFLTIPFAQINSLPLVGIGRSYLRNIKVGEEMRARDFTPVTLQMSKEALEQPDSLWNQYRVHELDDKELKTYHVVDSIGKAENFDRMMGVLQILATGMVPIGPLNIDLKRLTKFNDYEGFRLGLGLSTNDKVSKTFVLSGYYGYGFRDVHSKYGSSLRLNIYKKRNIWTEVYYEKDVSETGGNLISREDLTRFNNYYQFLINRMDQYEKKGFRFNGRIVSNITGTLFMEESFIKSFEGYSQDYMSDESVTLTRNTFYTYTTGVQVRYAPGEKLARMGDKEIRLGGRWPIFYGRYTKGWDQVSNGELAFDRFDFTTEKTFKMKLLGNFNIRLNAGICDNNVPLSILYNAQGSNKVNYKENQYLGIAASQTFETMRVNEFMHSQFVSVHLRHSFNNLLYKSKKFNPEVILVHNMLWGDLKYADKHNTASKQATEGYFESGFQVDRLLNMNLTGFGLGVFYRYGPYSSAEFSENLATKLSLSISF